jgi:4-hydroxy-3-methylbut-2-enyl diphosphate reductase
MPRKFATPFQFISSPVKALKGKGRDLEPVCINGEKFLIKLARHFGFCFGVENAVEIAYKALEERVGSDGKVKDVYLFSEMIHNPRVNEDLIDAGVQFLFSPAGEVITPLDSVAKDSIIILPAFGVPPQTKNALQEMELNLKIFDTTCPFVEKVWRRAKELGEKGFAILIHGKHYHEETRATFAHAEVLSPVLVLLDMSEAEVIGDYITGKTDVEKIFETFVGRFSPNFQPERDLFRFGIVNQTTMLAEETRAISTYLRGQLKMRFGEVEVNSRFADTRDTLCYATTENQSAALRLLADDGDLSLIIGGYNSSNTAHLAKIFAAKLPAYHIESEDNILSLDEISHLPIGSKEEITTFSWWPKNRKTKVLITAGASTPDKTVENVMERIAKLNNEILNLNDKKI